MVRRHPLLFTLGISFLIVIVAAAVYIATFDLNHYRVPLQKELSRRLSMPVQLGKAHLSLRHGPAVEFSNLVIGPKVPGGSAVRIGHLYLQPKLGPLFEGRLIFSHILVDAPEIRLVMNPPPASAQGATPGPAAERTRALPAIGMIRSLTLSRGTIRFLDRRDPARTFTATLQHVNASFADLSPQKPIPVQITGELVQGHATAPLSLTGSLDPAPDPFDWTHAGVALALHFRAFSPGPLLHHYAPSRGLSVQGKATITAALKGSPATGLAFKVALEGTGLALHAPARYRRPLAVKKVALGGSWVAAPGSERVKGLALSVDGLAVKGQLALEKAGGTTRIEGTLTAPALPVSSWLRLLPDQGIPSPLTRIRTSVKAGTLQIHEIRFSGPVSAFAHADKTFPLQNARLTLKDAEIALPGPEPLTGVSGTVAYADHRLTLTGGQALLGKAPIRFQGALKHPFGSAPEIALQASANIPVEQITEFWAGEMPTGLRAGGNLPVTLSLGGSPGDLLAHFRADLTPLSLGYKTMAAKPSGAKGDLSLAAEIFPDRLEVKKGTLSLPPLDLRVSGRYRPADGSFQGTADLQKLNLKQLVRLAPVLTNLHPQGAISARVRFSGTRGKLRRPEGTIDLHDFGIHLTRVIADLDKANGRILLAPDGLRFPKITAKLGTSSIRVSGTLDHFADPRFDLTVRAATIRGEDLFFFSRSALLHHLKAHLVIDRHHLAFAPATVRLLGGTKATVRGSVRFARGARVNLDIESDRADIDQVIALWQGPPSKNKPKEEKAHEEGSLFILAKAKQGTLANLHFERARGEITLRGKALVIQPLHFYSGKGYCTGQVVVDHQAGSPPLLKISGHLKNFDATAVYRQLLKKRGLITGTLDGDFFLQGRAGKEFLPTSLGGFHMEVKKGVLHKFQVLSKVFSLLNVSQIFSLKLPDMSLHGMPFDRLTGSFTLRKGILSTDDLTVDSQAMNLSLVGRMNLRDQKIDLVMGVKPLKTVDKIITHIPIAGWLLTGKEKALITAYFKIKGKSDDPQVDPIPITSISHKVLGIFKRIFGLPEKVITDMGDLLQEKKGQ
jgi:uncharacterized protein involved in outer membrane biogenesis